MAEQNERLREELFAAQTQNALDRRLQAEQNALIRLLERLNNAPTHQEALDTAIKSIKNLLNARDVFIAMPEEETSAFDSFSITSTTDAQFLGHKIPLLSELQKPRNIVNLQTATAFAEILPKGAKSAKSALSHPLQLSETSFGIIICLQDHFASFRQQDIIYLKQSSEYIVKALNMIDLRAQYQLLAVAIEAAEEAVGVCDKEGGFVYANNALVKLLKQGAAHTLGGKKWREYYTPISADIRLYENNLTDTELLELKGEAPRAIHEISQRKAHRLGTVLIIRDVTEIIKERQRQVQLNEELERARRQDAIAQMATQIAHDFNNILSAINGSAMLIITEEGVREQEKQHAKRIVAAGRSAAQSINQLLNLGADQGEEGIFDLTRALSDATQLARASLGDNVKLRVKLTQNPITVYGIANDAIQAVVNLILNARDALKAKGGEISVSLTNAQFQKESTLTRGRLQKEQPYARISVKDNGTGIAPELINTIFTPYFSTKGEQGTGIGLASLVTLTEKIKGAIDLKTKLKKGTEISLYWPLSDFADLPSNIDLPSDFLQDKVIMVIDDDPKITAIMTAFLERFGAEVSQIDDPKLALDILLEDPKLWHCVITDYNMPEMTGGDLAKNLRENGFAAPIFIVTALAKRLDYPHLTDELVQGIFAKPVNFSRFGDALSDMLCAKSGML